MKALDLDSERVARLATEEFFQGALRSVVDDELVFETQNNRYRVVDGICFDATSEGYVGAELVGWLFENERMSAVSAWWRRGARAVLVVRGRSEEIIVTSPTVSLAIGGRPARDGYATQCARFVVVRPDSVAALSDADQRDVRPSSPGCQFGRASQPPAPPPQTPEPPASRPPPPLRFALPRVPLLVAPEAVAALHGAGLPRGQVWLPAVCPPPRH